MNNELRLLQLVDSASPTGAFSHSFGMETAFKENKITGPDALYEWMQTFISGALVPTEGYAVYITHKGLTEWLSDREMTAGALELIKRLDQKLFLSKIPRESREGSMKIGKRYLKIVNTLYPEAQLDLYNQWIKQQVCYGNSAIVHGWIAAYLNISTDTAIFTYLYTTVNNQLQSALRLTAVGQTDVQRIMQRLYPLMNEEAEKIMVTQPTIDDLFTFSITQEIEAMRHETLYSRLFMS